MYLLIDTISAPEAKIVLFSEDGVLKKSILVKSRPADLPAVFKTDPYLRRLTTVPAASHGGQRRGLKGIMVVSGPGEFSAVRQGVAVANALSWSLGIPIKPLQTGDKIDVKKGWGRKLIRPTYLRPPNITKPK